jgi:hypothetical protein
VRWGICPEGKSPLIAQELLCKCFPEHRWNVIHLQMIYFGREFCAAKMHKVIIIIIIIIITTTTTTTTLLVISPKYNSIISFLSFLFF